jgi:hypothetical protein
MSNLAYSPLSRDEVRVLLAPGAEDAADAWARLTGSFQALLGLRTLTYTRPLIPEGEARESIPESLDRLGGTPMYAKAVQNARTVEAIERRFRDGKAGADLYLAVDDYIEALLDEWEAIRHYPETPPVLLSVRGTDSLQERHVAG